jgi:hypothetical protein
MQSCGRMHICSHDTCHTSLNHEGHSICNITGLCTKMLSFSNLEFVNTVCERPTATQSRCKKALRLSRKKRFKYIAMNRPHLTDKKSKDLVGIDDIVNTFVREMLCSEQWEHSNRVEHERYASKWSAASTKVCHPSCGCKRPNQPASSHRGISMCRYCENSSDTTPAYCPSYQTCTAGRCLPWGTHASLQTPSWKIARCAFSPQGFQVFFVDFA